jgi:hypothetical protein
MAAARNEKKNDLTMIKFNDFTGTSQYATTELPGIVLCLYLFTVLKEGITNTWYV